MSLDSVCLYVSSTAALGVVGSDTRLQLTQRGSRVFGNYSGGNVRRGCLVGNVSDATLVFRFVQREATGEVHAGRSVCDIIRTHEGRIRILEHFAWTSRAGSGTNVFDQLPDPLK